jgi:hypothetical protein
MERAAFCFGNDGLRPPTGGCSAVANAAVYGRNYDFKPRYYGARLALVQPTGSYASLGASELLTGRLDGMNERGLVIGLHRVRTSRRYPGLSSVVIVRLVLDQCASTAEAVAMLRRLPHAMAYNYSLLDADGVAAVVEAVPGSVAVRTGPWLACTNHFQSPLLRPLNRRAAHSQMRLPQLEALASRGASAEQTFLALNRSTSPAAALDEDMVDVNLDAWVGGKDLAVTHLAGSSAACRNHSSGRGHARAARIASLRQIADLSRRHCSPVPKIRDKL